MEELNPLRNEPNDAFIERYRQYLLQLRANSDRTAIACRDANNAWFRACRDGRDVATIAALARTRGQASRAAGVARGLVDIHTARFLALAARSA